MARNIALGFGVFFTLIGLLGFVSNPIVGEGALFETDIVHNIVHLLTGILALAAVAMGATMTRMYLQVFGVVYALVAVLGFFMNPILGFLHVNMAYNLLHLAVAAVFLWAGFMGGRQPTVAVTPPPQEEPTSPEPPEPPTPMSGAQ